MNRVILVTAATALGTVLAFADDPLPTYKVTADLTGLDLTALDGVRTDRVEGPEPGATVTVDGPLVTAESTVAAPFTFVGDPTATDSSYGTLMLVNTGLDLAATPFAFSGYGVTYFQDAYTITSGWTRAMLQFDERAAVRFSSVFIRGENGVPAALHLTPDEPNYTERGKLYGVANSPGSRGFDNLRVGAYDNSPGVFTVTDCTTMFVDHCYLGVDGSNAGGTVAITNSQLDVYDFSTGAGSPGDGSNLATTNTVIIGPDATLNISLPMQQLSDASLQVVFAGGEWRSREGNNYIFAQSGKGHVLVTTEPGCDLVFNVPNAGNYRDIYANGQKVDFEVSGNLVKLGKGILKVSAPIDYAGDTYLQEGVLRLADAGALPWRPLHASPGTSISLEHNGRLAVPSIDGPVRVYSEGSSYGTLAIGSDADITLPNIAANVNVEKLGSGMLRAYNLTGDRLTVKAGCMDCAPYRSDVVPSRFWRFKVEGTRGTPGMMQFSDIRLYSGDTEVTQSAQAITWDTEQRTTQHADANHGLPYPLGEEPEKAWDGNVSTKWLDWRINSSESIEAQDSVWLCFDFGAKILITKYEWYTANDAPERDPAAWRFQSSNDGETWYDVDIQTDFAATTDRQKLAYTYDNGIPLHVDSIRLTQLSVAEQAELLIDGFDVTVENFENKGMTTFGAKSSLTFVADAGVQNTAYCGYLDFESGAALRKTGSGTFGVVGLDSFGGQFAVDEGSLVLRRSAFDPTAKFIRFTVKRTHGGGILQMSELSFYDADGNRINLGMTKASAGTPAAELEPGSYCKAGDYAKGSGEEDVDKLFDNNVDTKACFTGISLNDQADESQWRTVVMRLPAAADIVDSYSFTTANDETPNRNPTSWTVELSADGVNWNVIDEQFFAGYEPTSIKKESAHFALQSVRDAVSALAMEPTSAFAAGSSVSVAPGARLVLDDDGVTMIHGLTLDASVGGGTIENFQAAAGGVLDLVNAGSLAEILAMEGPLFTLVTPAQDSASLGTWSVRVNGENTGLRVKQTASGIELVRFGTMIFVR